MYEELEGKNSEGWKRCNDEILELNDRDLKRRAGKYREFFEQNNEKPTGFFFNLGKEKDGDDNTQRIKNDNGDKFVNSKQRGEYIRRYYENLYKKRMDRLLEIEEFLEGRENGQLNIDNRKLTEVEKESLEGGVTLNELEKSLGKSNMNSACGWDGVSYFVIKRYWSEIGPILLKATNEGFANGEMGATFRTGLIKLIPKKGDATKISDWRPISLLCCGYKIISGVVANRLEKFISKNIGRGQKGFLKHKNIGTCGVNIIDNISRSWVHREKMGVLCVDFSKAFDCVEHEFINKVLVFFNYGENMVGMVRTILRGRQGRILMDMGVSDIFKVERGTPQGDKASPYIFILCIEILLIKLEMEAGDSIGVCNFIEQIREKFGLESMLSEAYADNLTVLFKWDRIGLNCLLKILRDFSRVSGLEINEKKTQLMITGGEDAQVGSKIGDITVVESISVLGIKIDRKLEKLDENWEKVIGKMENYSRYWNMFKLSISGRVMVARTYIISQATYLMGIIPLSRNKAEEMNRIIVDYVNGGERILAYIKWICISRQTGFEDG